ncbi:phosphopyruvate hydratase [Methermicoccus shengliensis]|uniref:Enolase n=1 Tax=Methermicoccus shengliensis TaxID=660064 RepID=A0A832RTY7_9EURY|nr:phosphopyruvate hydratase [Methermicoccus shengliensis]KUK04505.1 MAG: Enolase [Euryarchaeota archaeon 55_53]KUK30589.1 MAG: Enolase [Methanosarcinales archeaon 56_1174]MDI3488553.1 enolase [Methanosarcinales archaeon]MDN5295412.1 enolase [Methanosarcinales archaeon]HIH70180.1 phosphopyruvate hydratase [Methermicoccus shengliensis]
MTVILDVRAREILDSRGNPTVEVDVRTESGFGRACVPSGASTGTHEAVELRDGGERYHGKGVLRAVRSVNEEIGPSIVGMDSREQRELDMVMCELDGTPNKSRLGANAIVGTSLACAKAAASSIGISLFEHIGTLMNNSPTTLPVPTFNVLNGGKHAGNELAIQEFMIQPVGAPTFAEGLRYGVEVYHALGSVLEEKYGRGATNVGFEGGYAPPIVHTRDALDALMQAIDEAGYTEHEVMVGIDAAASEFYSDGRYHLDGMDIPPDKLMTYYEELASEYPLLYIEDPFHEEDYENYATLTRRLDGVMVVGDDIFVTNPKRIQRGIAMHSASALLLKVNQIGTLSEALDAARMVYDAGWRVVASHRSAETEDAALADIAVGIRAQLIKTGAPARGERTAKYNQLLRIEEQLGERARYARLR